MTDPTRILIIDDDENTRGTLSQIFEQKGFQVETAANGKEALERVGGGSYDIALIDLMLPDQSGLDLVQSFRKSDPDMASVIITGHTSTDSAIGLSGD